MKTQARPITRSRPAISVGSYPCECAARMAFPVRIGTSTTGIGFFLPGFIVLDHVARNRIRCGVGWCCRARPGMLPGKLRFTLRFLLLLSRALGCGVAGAGHPVTLPSLEYRSNMLFAYLWYPELSTAAVPATGVSGGLHPPSKLPGWNTLLLRGNLLGRHRCCSHVTRRIAAVCQTSPRRLLDLPEPIQSNPMPPRKIRRGS